MTERYLTTVLEEAKRVAEEQNQIARSSDQPAHRYLRYAVLRLLEGHVSDQRRNFPQPNRVTVGYGVDSAMFDSWNGNVEWWETVPPQEDCTRFRIFYPDERGAIPRVVVDVMNAIGAWRVWSGKAVDVGSYDHRDRREVHFLWPQNHPVEELLQERLDEPGVVAPDGGQTGDVRDRMLASENETRSDLEPRTRRAVNEKNECR